MTTTTMTLKQIDRNIAGIVKSGEKFNTDVQMTALAIVEHAKAHGDCTRALALVMALPKSARRNLLINWFAEYSPIGMNVGTGKVGFIKPESPRYKAFNIEGATANPWYVEQTAAAAEVLDVTMDDINSNIISFAKRLEKKLADGKVAANDVKAVETKIAALRAVAG